MRRGLARPRRKFETRLHARHLVARGPWVGAYDRRVAAVGVIDGARRRSTSNASCNTVALVIVDEANEDLVRQALTSTLDRRRPLHWESEGSVVKQRFVDTLCQLPVVAHVCASIVHRAAQQAARASLLDNHLLERAGAAGAGRLVIEQRSRRENDRDRSDIRRLVPYVTASVPRASNTSPRPSR